MNTIKPKIWACTTTATAAAAAAPQSRFLHLALNLNYSIIFLATSILHTNFGNLREWAIQICFQKWFLTFGSGPKIVFWKHIFFTSFSLLQPCQGTNGAWTFPKKLKFSKKYQIFKKSKIFKKSQIFKKNLKFSKNIIFF